MAVRINGKFTNSRCLGGKSVRADDWLDEVDERYKEI